MTALPVRYCRYERCAAPFRPHRRTHAFCTRRCRNREYYLAHRKGIRQRCGAYYLAHAEATKESRMRAWAKGKTPSEILRQDLVRFLKVHVDMDFWAALDVWQSSKSNSRRHAISSAG